MKTKKILPVLTFLAGIVAGGAIISMMSFSAPEPSPPPQPVPIDVPTARTLHSNFMMGPVTVYNNVIKGVFIDREQYDAMTLIFNANSNVSGFRIYYGILAPSTKVGVVVGTTWDATTRSFRDVTTGNGRIYRTMATGIGPCPDICDATSPIVVSQ